MLLDAQIHSGLPSNTDPSGNTLNTRNSLVVRNWKTEQRIKALVT